MTVWGEVGSKGSMLEKRTLQEHLYPATFVPCSLAEGGWQVDFSRVAVGWFLAGGFGLGVMCSAAVAEPTLPAPSVAAVTTSEAYRRGFLDGYRARSQSDRRQVDRPYLRWRDPGSARPRDGYGPYWRNRPRPWLAPDVYAERRFRGDGPDRRRSLAKPGVIEAASNGAQPLRPTE